MKVNPRRIAERSLRAALFAPPRFQSTDNLTRQYGQISVTFRDQRPVFA